MFLKCSAKKEVLQAQTFHKVRRPEEKELQSEEHQNLSTTECYEEPSGNRLQASTDSQMQMASFQRECCRSQARPNIFGMEKPKDSQREWRIVRRLSLPDSTPRPARPRSVWARRRNSWRIRFQYQRRKKDFEHTPQENASSESGSTSGEGILKTKETEKLSSSRGLKLQDLGLGRSQSGDN